MAAQAWDLSQVGRSEMETRPSIRLPQDHKLYPGKMDHVSAICFRCSVLEQEFSPSGSFCFFFFFVCFFICFVVIIFFFSLLSPLSSLSRTLELSLELSLGHVCVYLPHVRVASLCVWFHFCFWTLVDVKLEVATITRPPPQPTVEARQE
jgi:hypothetical protein